MARSTRKTPAAASAGAIRKGMRALGDPAIAQHSAGFFKTGPGEYGEGDRFHGIRVPVTRRLARRHRFASERTVMSLLRSAFHEERLLAVLLLVDRYARGDAAEKQRVFDLYVGNRRHVNNWDIVDSSAHSIVGPHLDPGDTALLDELAESEALWDRRIAMIATLHFIRGGEFEPTLRLAEKLLDDREDLIHKATGWMLREVGKRDASTLRRFLAAHCIDMPRTMLRYAIEKLPAEERQEWLQR